MDRGARAGGWHDVCVGGLHVTSGLDEPSGLGRQWADSASFYSLRGSVMAASAFAITASARSIAARNSSLFQVSTEWPSSNDSSVASCARETNSRSAAIASASSLASAPFREDCVTSITPSHRNFGPPCSIVTNDDSCNCPLVIAVKRDSAAPSLALVLVLAGGHPDEGASASRFQPRWPRSNRAIASGCAAICHMRGHRLACSDRTTSSLQRASPSTLERLCSGGPSTESASCGAAPDVPHDAIPHVASTSQRRPGFATKGPSRTRARVRGGVRQRADGIRAMPSARALLVASLLTEPPFGCLGPSGNDRYRKRSETVGASQVNCQVAAALSQ